jgi:alpha-tubulin suppressor-like RCC1 family protein
MMRYAVLALGTLGCGRVAFDARPDAAASSCARARAVGVGRGHTCLVDPGGTAWCWGLNDSGQVDPAAGESHIVTPRALVLSGPAVAVGGGRAYTCALLEDGAVWCWGDNNRGQLGDGTTQPAATPIRVPLSGPAVDLEVGAESACVRRTIDASIECWGASPFGENVAPGRGLRLWISFCAARKS